MSLYRKYRPTGFTDVYGQDHVVDTLKNGIEHDKLVHAYLFAGSRGTGKTSVARILAKSLMLRGIEDEVIRKQIEKGVDDGSIVDLLEIDAASNRGIDHVRDLIEKIQFSPVVASAKVYIVDEVHMLTKESFNALLKTLEEPPSYAYFILATTEFNKIPETIKSRCQCFPFRHISEEDMVRRLQFIADQESITIDREALRAIAHASDGGMRDAISLLDQMQSIDSITLEDVKQRIGSLGHEFVDQVLEAVNDNNREALLKSIRQVEEAGVPLDVFAKQILKIIRDALHKNIADEKQVNAQLDLMNTLLKAIRDIRISPVPGLVLEAALLTACGTDVVIQADPTLEPKKPEPKPEAHPEPTPKEPEPTKPSAPAEEEQPDLSDALIEAPEVSLENIRGAWANVVENTKPASVKMSLKNGAVTGVEQNRIELSFTSAFHKDRVSDTDASRAIEEVLQNVFKQKLKLECRLDSQPSATEPAKAPENDESMVNLADAAAEIF